MADGTGQVQEEVVAAPVECEIPETVETERSLKLHPYTKERLEYFSTLYPKHGLSWLLQHRPDLSYYYKAMEVFVEKVLLLYLASRVPWKTVRLIFKFYEATFLYIRQAQEEYPTSCVWTVGQYNVFRRAIKLARVKEVTVPLSYVEPHTGKRSNNVIKVGGRDIPSVAIQGA